ncbi:MAG: hypothetical protein LBV44_02880, partial [Methylobacillus sp.]|nr:hypothetical protein [Methylobacillus sp.]
MDTDFNRSLKEFSDKHGAVLLGMHKELQGMQISIDLAMQEVAKAKNLSDHVKQDLAKGLRDLAKGLSDVKASAEVRLAQIYAKQSEAQKLYDKALALLAEHKQRETAYHRKIETLAKLMLATGGALTVLLGVML